MADIDVVAKKGGAGWMMWVLLALVAVVVVWLLMRGGNENERVSRDGGLFVTPVTDIAAAAHS